MPQFDLTFDFGHPGEKVVPTSSTKLLTLPAAKPTVSQEALIRRNRAGYTRKEQNERKVPHTALPSEKTSLTANARKDKTRIEWAGTEIDRAFKTIDPETRKLFMSWLWSRANGGVAKATKTGGVRTERGFEPYVRELIDKVAGGKIGDIRKDVAAFKATRDVKPEETDVGVDPMTGQRYPTQQGMYANMVREGADPAKAEKEVAGLTGMAARVKPFVSSDTPSPERQKMYDKLVHGGMEPWEAAKTVVAQTAPDLTPHEGARMAKALAGIAPNSPIGDARNLPGPRAVRDAYTKAAKASRDITPIQSEDVDAARETEPTYMGQMGKNLGNSWLKSQYIRGRDPSKASNLDLWIDAAAAGQQPFTTAMLMGSGKAIEEHSAEERGLAMIGDFVAQIVLTGGTKAIGKGVSRVIAGEARAGTTALAGIGARGTVDASTWGRRFAAQFGKTPFGQMLTKERMSEGAIQAALQRMGAGGSAKGLIIARESLARLGDYAPEFLALDMPGFAYMVKESGGDPLKAAGAFGDQITSGFHGGFDPSKPFDEQVTAGIGLATGLMMAVGALTLGGSALRRMRMGPGSGLQGTDFRHMTDGDIETFARAAEAIKATGATEEGFAKLSNDIKGRTGKSAMEIATEARMLMDQQGVTARIGEQAANKIAMDIGTVKAAGEALDAVKGGIKGEDAEGAQGANQPAPDAQGDPVATPPAADVVAPGDSKPASWRDPDTTPTVYADGSVGYKSAPTTLKGGRRSGTIVHKSNARDEFQVEGGPRGATVTHRRGDTVISQEGYGTFPIAEAAAKRKAANVYRESQAGADPAATPVPQGDSKPEEQERNSLIKQLEVLNGGNPVQTEGLDVAALRTAVETLNAKKAAGPTGDGENLIPDMLEGAASGIRDSVNPNRPPSTPKSEAGKEVKAAVESSLDKAPTAARSDIVDVIAKVKADQAVQNAAKNSDRANLKIEIARAVKRAVGEVITERVSAGEKPAADFAEGDMTNLVDRLSEELGKKGEKKPAAAPAPKAEPVAADALPDHPDLGKPNPAHRNNETDVLWKTLAKKRGGRKEGVIHHRYDGDKNEFAVEGNDKSGTVTHTRDGEEIWNGTFANFEAAQHVAEGYASQAYKQSPNKQNVAKPEAEPSSKTQVQNESEKTDPSNARQVTEDVTETPPSQNKGKEDVKGGEIPKADSEGYGSTVDEQTKREYEEMKARRKKAREEAASGGEHKVASGLAWDEGDYDDLLVAMKYHAKAIGAEALKAAKVVREMIARALDDVDHSAEPDDLEVNKAARLAMRTVGFSLEDARKVISDGMFEDAAEPKAKAEAELPEGFEKLPYDHDKYFLNSLASPNATVKDVPIEDFIPLRARPDGIANANKIMLVVKPEGRREPVSVVEEGGKYKIMDGNSTFANAKMSGWKDLRVQVFKTEADALEHERLGKEAKKAQKAAMAKVKETVIKSIAEPIAKEIAQSHDDAANLTDDQLRSLVDERAERFAKDKLASLSKQLPEGKEFFERMLGMVDGANDELLAKVAEFIHKPEIDITAHDHMVKPDAPASVPEHETIDLTLSRSEQAKQLHEQAVERLPEYQEWLKSTLKVDGVDKHYEGVKSLEGIADKPGRGDWIAGKEYRDVKHVQDALRSTSVISTIDAISELASTLPEGWTVAEFKNRFLKPTELGYMDINVTLRMPDGFLTEHQINFDQMIEAKQGAGHFLYEVARSLGDPSKLSGKIADIYREAGQLQAMAYSQAWEKFLHQADLTEDAATASLAKASDSWSSRTRQLDSSGSRATSPGAQTPPRLTNEEPGLTITKASSESLDNQPLGDTRENLISTSNTSIDDPAAKPVQKGGYRSYNQAKGRGVMVYGVGKDAPVLKWASDIQRDLFDLHKQMIKLGGIKGRGKADIARKAAAKKVIELIGQSMEDQTGLSGKEVLAAAAKVHDDVRAQMKGVGKGQAKDLDENLFGVGEKLGYNKPSDDQSSTRSKGPADAGEPGSGSVRLLDEQPAKPLQRTVEGGDAGTGVRESGKPDQGIAHAPRSDERPSGSKRPTHTGGSGDNGRARTGYHSDNLVLPAGEFVEIPGSKTAKAKTVVEVMDTLHAIEDRGGKATLEEKMILAKYPGWGWTGDLLNPANAKPGAPLYGDYMSIMERLDPKERAEAFSAILNSHYTSPEIVSVIWDGVRRLGVTEGKPLLALEPSAGSGLFVTQSGMEGIDWRLIEKDGLTARILRAIHTGSEVVHNGFEKTPKGQNVDLAISNVPFGNFGVTDVAFQKVAGKWVTESIHNYFIARMISEARENGLVVAITSRYTMDGRTASHIQMREYMHQNAELLLAVRLPETAFRGAANTDVVTDVLFMRKRVAGEAIGPNPYGQSVPVDSLVGADGSTPYVNEYYHANPERQLGKPAMEKGMFASEGYTLKSDGGDLVAQLAGALQSLPRGIFEHAEGRTKVEGGPPVHVPNDVRSGAMFDGKERGIFRNAGGLSVRLNVADSVKVLPKKFQKADAAAALQKKMEATSRDFFKIRDAVHATISGMRGGVDDIELGALQDDLKSAIEAYRKAHGPLNQQNLGNKGEPLYPWWYDDPDGPTVRALEVFDFDTKEVKGFAALVTSRNIDPVRKVTKADSAQDALYASLHNSGGVDVKAMAALAGTSEKQITKDLEGVIFYDHTAKEWQLADQYAQGNVREKLKAAEEAKDKNAITYLESIMPPDRKASQITASLGATWMDDAVFEDFVYHLLGGTRPVKTGYKDIPKNEQVVITRSEKKGSKASEYTIKIGDYAGRRMASAKAEYSTPDWGMSAMLKSAINNTDIKIYNSSKESKALDPDKTAAANEIKKRIRREFREWVFNDATRTEKVVAHYNERVNVYSGIKYDGAHITVPGAEPWVMERSQRKAAVWRILTSQEGVLLAHEVGTGKTLTMAAAAIEGRRTGLVKKAMYVAHNATVAQTVAEIARGFPGSRILAANDHNFSAKQRRNFLAQAAVGDFDIVVLSQAQFELIASKQESRMKVLQAEIDELLEVAEAETNTKKAKQISKQIETIKAKIEKAQESIKGDRTTVFFEDIGIDMLLLDEAHAYKNLARASKHQSLSIPGSSRATDALIKIEAVRAANERGGRLVMATGTPIINSIGETHTWLKFLAPKTLQSMHMFGFDDFINALAEEVDSVERTPAGAPVRRKRFSKFINARDLRRIFGTVADVVRAADMVNAKGEKAINLPRYVDLDGKQVSGPISVVVEATRAQRDAFAAVSDMYNEWAALEPRARMETPHIPLVSTTEGKLASVDARLYDPSLPADEGGKIAKCVENVLKVYKSTAKEKGAQAIFLDSGVPNGERFDLYGDLTDRLVEAGIPKSEILSIYDVKRDDIGPTMRKVNAGQYRVVLGSTERLGTGINMQERLRAVHHLDSSYVASGLMQRDGRIMRSGNQYADGASIGGGVSVLYYITENSPDARMWTIVLRKVGIMNDVLYTADSEFGDTIEDVDPPSAVASFAEMTADAQGDPRMVRYIDLQAELAVLGNEGAYYQRQGIDRNYKLKKAERDAEEAKSLAHKLKAFAGLKKPEAGKWVLQGVSHKLETRKELGEFVNGQARKPASYYNTRSVTVRNGDLAVSVLLSTGEYPVTPISGIPSLQLRYAGEGAISFSVDGIPATYLIRSAKREEVDGAQVTTIWMAEGPYLGSGGESIKNGASGAGYKTLDEAIGSIIMEGAERLPKLHAQAENNAKIAEAEVPEFKKLAEAPWPKLEEYKALQEENDRLEDALGLKGKETQDITWAVNEADSAEELKDGDDPVEGEEESTDEPLGMPARTVAPGGSKWYRADIEPLAVPAGIDPKTLSADAVMMSVPRSAVGGWRFGKTLRGLVGQMNPKNKMITMRYHGSPHEFAHEIGHHLDDQYRLVPQMKPAKTKAGADHHWMKEFDTEILPLGDPFSPTSADTTRRRQEGIARFVQLYMVAPGKAMTGAPNFHKFFESKVPDTVLKDLREAGDKLRMIAGLDVVTRGGNQIEMEPSEIRKTSSMIAEAVGLSDGLKFPRYNIIGGFTTNWVDDLAGLEAAQKEAMLRLGIDEVLPSEDPTLLARTIKYHTQKINDIFENGMIDADGNRVTGPLGSILEPLDRTNMETLEKDLRDTMLLGISERQLEEAQRVMQDADNEAAVLRMDGEDEKADQVIARAKERADSMTGISGGILPDGDVQAALDIIAALKADPVRHAALAKSLERMRDVYDKVLEYAVEKGRFSREQVDEIRNTHQQYIALQRMMDGDQGLSFLKSSGGLKNVAQPIKQYKGSTRKIKSPFIAMLEQIDSTIFEADRNEIVTAMVDLLGGNEGRMYLKQADLSDLAVKIALDDSNKKNSIVIYRDGKQERWELDEVVYRALDIVGSPDMFDGLKAVRAIVSFTRQAITTFPAFAFFKNPIRDTVARVIHSRVGSKPWDIKLNPSKADRDRFSRFGGSIMETDYLNDRDMFLSAQRKLMEDAVIHKPKGWILSAPGRLWKAYTNLATRPEMANRLAEESRAFKFAKSKGWSDYDAQLYASQEARDLQDFRRGGRWARRVNQFIMFFNASVQGLDRAYRGAKADKKGYALRILLYTVLAEIVVNQIASSQGQDAEEEYANLPSYQKDFFWNIRVGDAGYIRLPKPFELGLPASFVGRVMSGMRAQAQGNTREASRWFEGFMGNAVKALLVVDENTFMGGPFAPLYEAMANFDFFRKKSIIPPYEESMILEDRKGTARASLFGRMLQAATESIGQGVDSRKIDHVVQQTFGGYGKVATSVGKPDREVTTADWLYMMTGLFTDKPAYGARDVQWVLKRASQIGTRKPLKDEVEAYFDAETKEEKDDAAKELLRRAGEIRGEMEDAAAGLPVREGIDAQRALFDLKPRDRDETDD